MVNDPERLINDWQEVLRQGKQMELTLEKLVCFHSAFLSKLTSMLSPSCRFFENIDLEGNPRTGEAGKDLEFYAVCSALYRFAPI